MPTDKTQGQSAKDKKIVEEIERKHGKTPAQLFEERDKRVRDAIALKEPDRVPVLLGEGVFAAKYSGLPLSAMYYDLAAFRDACRKAFWISSRTYARQAWAAIPANPDTSGNTSPALAGRKPAPEYPLSVRRRGIHEG